MHKKNLACLRQKMNKKIRRLEETLTHICSAMLTNKRYKINLSKLIQKANWENKQKCFRAFFFLLGFKVFSGGVRT